MCKCLYLNKRKRKRYRNIEIKGIIGSWILGIVIFLLGCKSEKSESGFFSRMKEDYKDLTFETNGFYLKDFGLSKKTVKINGNDYRELYCSGQSLFFLAGFIRLDQNKIKLLPSDFKESNTAIESVLFDFNMEKGFKSLVFLSSVSKVYICVAVELIDSKLVDGEKTYLYKLVPGNYYTTSKRKTDLGIEHLVIVSLKDGIKKIITTQEKIKDTIAECTFFPKERFVFRGWQARPI